MTYRNSIVASVTVGAAMAIVAGIALHRLPPDTQLPVHWGPDGTADGFADAGYALFLPVALVAAITLLFAAVPSIEPLQDRLSRSAPLLRATWFGLLALMMLVEAMVAAPAFGYALPAAAMLVGVGALLVVIGNALPKSRPGFFVGIRTPWTISDPDNWIATHRLGGRLFVAGGLALILVGVLPLAAATRAALVVAILLVAVATPILYSFLLWRRVRTR